MNLLLLKRHEVSSVIVQRRFGKPAVLETVVGAPVELLGR